MGSQGNLRLNSRSTTEYLTLVRSSISLNLSLFVKRGKIFTSCYEDKRRYLKVFCKLRKIIIQILVISGRKSLC